MAARAETVESVKVELDSLNTGLSRVGNGVVGTGFTAGPQPRPGLIEAFAENMSAARINIDSPGRTVIARIPPVQR
jgi:hypothetical protein